MKKLRKEPETSSKYYNRISIIILVSFLMVTPISFSQSPYFSIKFSVTQPNDSSCRIFSKVCNFNYKPVISSGDYWFGKDTSKLDWDSLPDTMYSRLECGKANITTGNSYEISNQDMIWEKIYSFIVIEENLHTKQIDTMTFIFPVLIKSFVTYIDLGKIPFTPGYYELTHALLYNTGNDNYLHISLPENYSWKSVNFEERKIKF